MNEQAPMNVSTPDGVLPWSQTGSGRKWNLLDPRAEDVFWPDVAHHLAQTNRFAGGTKLPYSVAEHCCHAHDIVAKRNMPKPVRLLALLHDAHEFILGDWTTPIQVALDAEAPGLATGALKRLRAKTDAAIFAAAGLAPMLDKLTPAMRAQAVSQVKAVDGALVMQERNELMGPPPEPWGDYLESLTPAKARLACWPPAVARWEWLQRLQLFVALS